MDPNSEQFLDSFPILMLRDTVIFPHMVVSLFVGRPQSIEAVRMAWERKRRDLLLLTQKNPADESPDEKGVFLVGTVASLTQILELSDGTLKILVSGRSRAKIVNFQRDENVLRAQAYVLSEENEEALSETRILHSVVLKEFENYAKYNSKISHDFIDTVKKIDNPSTFTDSIAACFSLGVPKSRNFSKWNPYKSDSNVFWRFSKQQTAPIRLRRKFAAALKSKLKRHKENITSTNNCGLSIRNWEMVQRRAKMSWVFLRSVSVKRSFQRRHVKEHYLA